MRLLIDMNLSPGWDPGWNPALPAHAITSIHWSAVGLPSAPDRKIMGQAQGCNVVSCERSLSEVLAATSADGPSVVQLRATDVLPSALVSTLATVLRTYRAELMAGAVVSIDQARARVRTLPLAKP
jgi:predicted nuclease of predicted toxin-antitoxin system